MRKRAKTYLIYRIDEGPRIVLRKLSDCLNQGIIRKDRCDQGNAFVRGEGRADQPLPGWFVTGDER